MLRLEWCASLKCNQILRGIASERSKASALNVDRRNLVERLEVQQDIHIIRSCTQALWTRWLQVNQCSR